MTGLAFSRPLEFDIAVDTTHGVLKFDTQVIPQIRAASRPRTATGSAAAKAEKLLKNRTKAGKDIAHILKATEALTREALMTKAVVGGPLLGIGEDLVGLRGLFKLVLGLFATGVAVRVILQGRFAIS
jgi:hypothetical protein